MHSKSLLTTHNFMSCIQQRTHINNLILKAIISINNYYNNSTYILNKSK